MRLCVDQPHGIAVPNSIASVASKKHRLRLSNGTGCTETVFHPGHYTICALFPHYKSQITVMTLICTTQIAYPIFY